MWFSPILFEFVFHMGLILFCFVLCPPVNPILHCLTILSYLLRLLATLLIVWATACLLESCKHSPHWWPKEATACKSPQYVWLWLWLGLWLCCCVSINKS